MNEGIVVLVTVPEDKAKELAGIVLKEKAAACVNVLRGIDSYFWWEGKIDSAKESLLLIKTKKVLFDKLRRTVEAHHPYDVPEIVAIGMDNVNDPYLRWINEVTDG